MSSVAVTVQALLATPAIVSLVSTRVEPHPGRSTTPPPMLAVQLVAETDIQNLAGAAKMPEGRVSVHCIALSSAAADALGEAVIAALDDFAGTVLTSKKPEFVKQGADFTDHEAGTFRRVVDYYVRWRR